MTKHATFSHQAFSDAFDQLDALDSRLLNAHHLARTYADMTGDRRDGIVQVDAAAIGGSMGFFADEMASARELLDRVFRLVKELHGGK